MLPDQPTQFIFGYGSLVNSASRNATAGRMTPAIPVRVSAAFGYIRVWNDRSLSEFTARGLRKAGPGEKASTINGVLYAADVDDIAKFDAREQGYARVEVPRLSKLRQLDRQIVRCDWVFALIRGGEAWRANLG